MKTEKIKLKKQQTKLTILLNSLKEQEPASILRKVVWAMNPQLLLHMDTLKHLHIPSGHQVLSTWSHALLSPQATYWRLTLQNKV